MAIVQMFGFDQITPTSGANLGAGAVQVALNNEGFAPLTVDMSGVNQIMFVANQGRTWLQFSGGYSGSTITSRLSMTLAEWFGPNPDKKKCYFGARINMPYVSGGQNWSYTMTINNSSIFLLSEMLMGITAYYEICFDPEKNIIQRWIDGTPLSDISWTYGDTQRLQVGLYMTNQYMPTWQLQITDIYSVIDTEDDTPCTRLGAVRVTPLSLESVVPPADWLAKQPEYIPPNEYLGVLYRRPYPNFSQENYGEYKYTCNISPRSGAITYHIYSPTSTVEFPLTRPTVGSPLRFTLELPKPTKLALYKLHRSNSIACFYPTQWVLEGSNNGTDWTPLDSKTGQGTPSAYVVSQYVIPEANRAAYRYHRMSFTDATPVGAANYFHVSGLQFFTLNDEVLYSPLELLDREYSYDNTATDETGGALRTGVLETELVANMKKPVLNGEIPLKVQLRVSAARDSGTENRLLVTTRSGATVMPEQTLTLNSTMRQGVLVYESHKAPDGATWTPEAIDALELLIKSKTGAA